MTKFLSVIERLASKKLLALFLLGWLVHDGQFNADRFAEVAVMYIVGQAHIDSAERHFKAGQAVVKPALPVGAVDVP